MNHLIIFSTTISLDAIAVDFSNVQFASAQKHINKYEYIIKNKEFLQKYILFYVMCVAFNIFIYVMQENTPCCARNVTHESFI